MNIDELNNIIAEAEARGETALCLMDNNIGDAGAKALETMRDRGVNVVF